MRSRRVAFFTGLFVGVAFASLLSMPACGPAARDAALKTALVSLNTASAGFVEWDRQHQRSIVEHATSEVAGQTALDAYREHRQVVLHAFSAGYAALALAALEPKAENLASAVGAAQLVYDEIQALKKEGP